MYHLLAVAVAPLLFPRTVHAMRGSCEVVEVDAAIRVSETKGMVELDAAVVVAVVEAIGKQNYTCSPSGTYSGKGAYAEMYDISCMVADAISKGNSYQSVQDKYMSRNYGYGDSHPAGCYYYTPDPHDPYNATQYTHYYDWKCNGMMGSPEYYMQGREMASIPAPAPANASRDYPWHVTQGSKGTLAKYAYNVYTHGGQPPETCQPGSLDIEVSFSAMIWLYESQSYSYHSLSDTSRSTSTTTTTTTTTLDPTYYQSSTYNHWQSAPTDYQSSTYNRWASSTSAPTYAKAAELNAELSSDSNTSTSGSDSEDSKLQRLLKYAPVAVGLLAITTILSFIALVMSIVHLCRRRSGTMVATRSVPAYHPIQLPRSGQPLMEESYHDETKRYDA